MKQNSEDSVRPVCDPHDDIQRAIRLASDLPSVCSSIHLALRCTVCEINTHSFQRICLKHCILLVYIMKMCVWDNDGARVVFDRITVFGT